MARTYYIWDEANDTLLEETDQAGNTIVKYTHEPGQFGPLISQRRNGHTYNHHFDGQGSTRALTDELGNVTDTYAYTAFGEPVATSGTTTNPFGYKGAIGYYANPFTDDYYVTRRLLQASLGEWLSLDPVGVMSGQSTYVYCLNNPIGLVDPSGMAPADGDGGFYQRAVAAPKATGRCGGAEGQVYWLFKTRKKGLNGWIVQSVSWDYQVYTCDGTTKEVKEQLFFEGWEVANGVAYDGFKEPSGTNSIPPFADTLTINDRGQDTKGTIRVIVCAMFLKDYDLKPPWRRDGEEGHVFKAGTLPTLAPPPVPTGFKVGLAICKTLVSTWKCCCRCLPQEETDVSSSVGWGDS